MTNILAKLITLLNAATNAVGGLLSGMITSLPGWLSNTIIAAVAGVVLLILFKYTSNQKAIGRVRDSIKANMLALKLYKDSIIVTFTSQGRVFKSSLMLLVYSVRPMLVMIVPVSLLLAQLGLWYQYRPLQKGEQAVVTMKLNTQTNSQWPGINIQPATAVEVETGPVHVFSKNEICWQIKALEDGYHNLNFQVDQQQVEKELAIGDRFMRVSVARPGRQWSEMLFNPWEKPFGPDSVVQSISIDYPDRISWTSGTNWWVIYFFVISMVFAFIFKPFLKVRI